MGGLKHIDMGGKLLQSARLLIAALALATLAGVLGWITEILLLMWVILAVLHTVDIDTGPALASFGVVGIALGLGAQKIGRAHV